jgi:hypothetical protein
LTVEVCGAHILHWKPVVEQRMAPRVQNALGTGEVVEVGGLTIISVGVASGVVIGRPVSVVVGEGLGGTVVGIPVPVTEIGEAIGPFSPVALYPPNG